MENNKVIFRHAHLNITGSNKDIMDYINHESDVIKRNLEYARNYVIMNEDDTPHEFIRFIRTARKYEYILYCGSVDENGNRRVMARAYHSNDDHVRDQIDISELAFLKEKGYRDQAEDTIDMDDTILVKPCVEKEITQQFHDYYKDLPIFDKTAKNITCDDTPLSNKNTTTLQSDSGFYAGLIDPIMSPNISEKLNTEDKRIFHSPVFYDGNTYDILTRGLNRCIVPLAIVRKDQKHLLENPACATKILKRTIDVSVQDGIVLVDGKDVFANMKSKSRENDVQNDNTPTKEQRGVV